MSTKENINADWDENAEERQLTITLTEDSRMTIEDVKRAITELQTGKEGEDSEVREYERGYSA